LREITLQTGAPMPGPRRFRPLAEQLESRDLPAITTLSVQNTEPFARAAEPVTSGIPLPQSLGLLGTSQLRILDGAGRDVPAQFAVLARWNGAPQDAALPIKWLQIHFAADVPASATATYTL